MFYLFQRFQTIRLYYRTVTRNTVLVINDRGRFINLSYNVLEKKLVDLFI